MRIEHIVVNSSPLIVLFRSGQSDLLRLLFKEIVVPDPVYTEIIAGPDGDFAKEQLPSTAWLTRKAVDFNMTVAAWNLGAGESSVFSFALENPVHVAVVDDLSARRCARTLNIRTIGTGALMVLAKRRGLIKSVRSHLGLLRDAGLYLSDSIVDILAIKANE